MDVALVVFLTGTAIAAFVTGLAGFAFGLVAAGIWLHALSPADTVTLIVAYALLVQGYAVWKLRHAIDLARLAPFVVGSAVGIPGGIALLRLVPAEHLRVGTGTLLVLFSLYNLARSKLAFVAAGGRAADGVVGIFNGVLSGATGLGGILPAIWSTMRGWSREEQRAVFQPTAVATFVMTMLWFGATGSVTSQVAWLFVVGLPALAGGTWIGWQLYGRLDEASFRQIVLVLVLASGLALALSGWRH